jgi:protein O-mannosyl-transferase
MATPLSGVQDRWTRRPWLLPLAIALLAIGASASGILNQYTQDDIPIIFKHPAMHSLRGIGRFFVESYWPPPFIPALYRPFASVSFALQWAAGSGAPAVFRAVSYILYALTSVAVFSLARLGLPLLVAAAVGALFAVHPVHVEAVAVAINQSELWAALLLCVAVTLYVRARRPGRPVGPATELRIAGLYLTACLFKENALMLPGMLVAAEALLVRSGEPVAARIAQGRRLLLLLVLVAVAFTWVRGLVLEGDLIGTYTAEGLAGQTMGGRALTMLAVVPQWFRLLLWPAHLQADYSPSEIVAQTRWGAAQTLGLALLAGTVLLAIAARRRAPAVTFGIAWCAIALFPVHNVLVPTGVVLAERLLFLPSVGVMIALGGLGALLLERAGPRTRLGLATVTGILLVLGTGRSAARHGVWSDQFNLWFTTAHQDAPRSFKAHEALADAYFNVDVEGMAEAEYRLAIRYSPPNLARTRLEYADRLRSRGFCYPAAQQYRIAIAIRPELPNARAGLVACLLYLGQYREAVAHARLGIAWERERAAFQAALVVADSALRLQPPPGTVRISMSSKSPLGPYMEVGTHR